METHAFLAVPRDVKFDPKTKNIRLRFSTSTSERPLVVELRVSEVDALSLARAIRAIVRQAHAKKQPSHKSRQHLRLVKDDDD